MLEKNILLTSALLTGVTRHVNRSNTPAQNFWDSGNTILHFESCIKNVLLKTETEIQLFGIRTRVSV